MTFNDSASPPRQQPNHFVLGSDTASLPIVIDSPHSGMVVPGDFDIVAPPNSILTTWDAFVDELWSGIADRGGVLLAAHFPRAYIDANRAVTDIDAEMLEETWPGNIAPEKYTARGMGLIRRYALPGVPLYARKLSVQEVQRRIEHYYLPYRSALKLAADQAARRHGALWHIDCHSMKSRGNAMNVDAGEARVDMVISDRRGTTADPAFTQWVAEYFTAIGYTVRINEPYQGGDLLCAVSDPAHHRHSIQIELNRRLYMDEAEFSKNEGFNKLQQNLNTFLNALSVYVEERLAKISHPS